MNYSSKLYLGDRPYDSYDEYLEDFKLYIIILLRCYIRKLPGTANAERGDQSPHFPDYFDVMELLNSELQMRDIDDDQESTDWYHTIESRRELSQDMGITFPIDHILNRAELDKFGEIILNLSLFATLHRKYQKVFQFINGDLNAKHPNMELCARLYCQKKTSDLSINRLVYSEASKLQILFPELAAAENLLLGDLICDERLIDLLFGRERYLTRGITISEHTKEIAPLMFRESELNCIAQFEEEKQSPLFLIYGDRGVGKKHLVKHFAGDIGVSAAFLDIKAFSDNNNIDIDSLLGAVRYAARECMIGNLILAITGFELLKDYEQEQLAGFINSGIRMVAPYIFILSDQEQCTCGIDGIYSIGLKNFTEMQRIELWKYYTLDYELEEDFSLDAIANTFIITPGQMIGAVRQAAWLSGKNRRTIKEKLLYQACYAQLDHKLAKKATRVTTGFSWEDLKLPQEDKRILRDICNCVKNRHIVMNEWNFSRIIPYGAGITVLFSGPPGTGKTMAAQVIANELKMELYKIDSSRIFDKYVGETEKNIKLIFDQAQKSNSILFFDEADAIFNKRLEASGSNERFANIESSLLLQCVEEYNGISILATNNFNSIDSAFIRRFKYYVLFREPDEAVRYEIWKSVIPKEAPLSENVDLRLLAKQFQFSGAVIKNVILSAAYLAAEKDEAISLIDILMSVKREMFKNNLILTKEKLGSLGYLFEDIK